jgi:type IV pilus assembly protein PilF
VKKLLVILIVLLTGCAQQPVEDQSQEANPSAPRVRAKIHSELASGYYSRGQLGVALEEAKTSVQADPAFVDGYNILGVVYMELREDAKAEASFQKALQIEPNNSEANNNYGWFLCQHDRIDESIKHFLSALKNPLYATPEKPYFNAGICSLKRKDDKSAIDFLKKALQVKPNLSQAMYYLADIYYRTGDLTLANHYIVKQMQTAPEPDADSLWLGVRIAHKLGDRDGEDSYSLILKQRFPGSPGAQALKNGHYE